MTLLAARRISKGFPGVRALTDVDLDVSAGEVLALIGENGAGKSTLMKILAGVQRPDGGTIEIGGRAHEIESVRAATALGIALIHQELNLCDNLTVAENLFLGQEEHRFGLLARARMERAAVAWLERVGLDVAPGRQVASLSIGQQQLLEIAKALAHEARILIMDEPTSSLSQHEAEGLFRVVRDLRASGTAIIYISHRLGEVAVLADRVVVLRDGENVGTLEGGEIQHEAMVRLMVGRDVAQHYQRQDHPIAGPVLEVRALRTARYPDHALSFDVRRGEIVGLAGLVGAGRTELLRVLFGIDPALAGGHTIDGKSFALGDPTAAMAAGMAFVPEERKSQGLLLDAAVSDNLSLATLGRLQRRGFVRTKDEREQSARLVEQLRIKTPGLAQLVRFLSGGNQQKVVLGKWLARQPRVLLLDEPTRGIDIGAKEEIYELMEKLAEDGVAVLFSSSDMAEVIGMADRVLVMHEGRLTGDLDRSELSEEAIMSHMTGLSDTGAA